MEDELQDYVTKMPEQSDTQTPVTERGDGYQIDWDALQAVNPDIVGWIRFDNPNRIDYPIVQGQDNQTYLNHDWQGRYQPAGSIFMHKENQPDFTN